ncbi:MAG: DUF2231 domain-containing protein [Gloeocapsa sp. DLM2.Bin57]|nr:MAG: DUF2231 domain-containing protein [Gloeocapsa sp. DLM2.Bin57]
MLTFTLSEENLPYIDPIHAIVVHFVIAMVIISFIFEVAGYITKRQSLLNAAWWNLLVAGVMIFVAIFFGQFEAGLAEPSQAAQPVLNRHMAVGWLLLLLLPQLTLWQGITRYRNPSKVSLLQLGAKLIIVVLVFYQVMLGTQVFWVHGIHVKPVVQATNLENPQENLLN